MLKKNNNVSNKRLIISIAILAVLGFITIVFPIFANRYLSQFFGDKIATLIALGVFFVTVLILGLVNLIISINEAGKLYIGKQVSDSVYSEFSTDVDLPIIICEDKGKIIWFNNALKRMFVTGNRNGVSPNFLYSTFIDSICDATVQKIEKADPEKGTEIHFNEETMGEDIASETYIARGSSTISGGKKYYAIYFTNITELKAAYTTIAESDTVIACAVIDNLDELVQYVQDLYNNAADEVESILKNYMDSVGGVLRGYGHNRFMMIFSAKDLASFEQKRFSVLDEVRAKYLGDSGTPVTISMGVAKIKGTLNEKERVAQAALDIALQRGGDQVVVKSDRDIDYYGGRTNSVPKRTKVRARVLGGQLVSLINESSNVLVMGHSMPDFDAIASCLAIARLSKHFGVRVNVVCDVKDKNLANAFAILNESDENYDDLFVDKVEAQNLLTSNTLAIVVDVNNIDYCEAPDLVKTAAKIVIIDHHRKVTDSTIKPNLTYIEPSASSASELISEFLEIYIPQGELPKVEADLLYAGIMLDTKRFTHNVGIRTFSSAMYLKSEDANPTDAEDLFRIGLKDFVLEAEFESNVFVYRTAIAIAMNKGETKSSLIRINAAKAADKMLSIDGIEAAFALCQSGDVVHVSARSTGSINVQLILEKIGGGGHFDSAGAQIRNDTISSALDKLRKAIDDYFEENELG
ncbi:MAG: DHH family phosphoesterase [Clostridia bacterium]|nr:DHH family phosphoesterase [Clostridia bacterium]